MLHNTAMTKQWTARFLVLSGAPSGPAP